jgi:acyl carrier protein
MEVRIKQVMSNVFNLDINSINSMSSPDNIENWDSLKHMNLVIALEEEFKVEFDDEEIADSMNYALILNIIKGK